MLVNRTFVLYLYLKYNDFKGGDSMSTNIFETVLRNIEDRVERSDVDCEMFLSNNSVEYREVQDSISEFSRIPEIENFFTKGVDLVLTAEQHDNVLEVLDLHNRTLILESLFYYLCGYEDCYLIFMMMENMHGTEEN